LGDETIRILGLDEDDAAQRHTKKVEPYLKVIQSRIDEGNVEKAQHTWHYIIESLFAEEQAFHALTWDMLDHRFPEKIRDEFGLHMPTLGRRAPLPPAPIFVDPPEMDALPEQLKLRVRALGSAAPTDVALAVLKDVLSLKAWSDEELARLFERAVSTIRSWRKTLVATATP
jgi:hypothetical protein